MNHICSPVFGEYYNGMKSCVLDIEATGLDPRTSKVVLMGLLTETDSGVKVTQFLAENHYEEDKVLQATIDFLSEEHIDYLITFNGIRYDVPFINTRLRSLFSDKQINLYDFDLYRFLRKYSVLPKSMESLSQSSVEAHFGIGKDRKDTITGRENIALFNEYSLTGNSTVEKIILTHNREDVLQLYKLMLICSQNEFADILPCDFHSAIAKYGFPACNGRFTLRPEIKKSQLIINGDQNFDAFSAAYFPDIDNPITATFSETTKSFEIILPLTDSVIFNSKSINEVSQELLNKYI